MSHVVYGPFEVPDFTRPVPPERRGVCGPAYELVPFDPSPLDVVAVCGRAIDEWAPVLGSYGMGGPGFLGFRFGDEWLIVALWGAGSWARLDGRLLDDTFYERHSRPVSWRAEGREVFTSLFAGDVFVRLDVEAHRLEAALASGRMLVISGEPPLPNFEGSGERPMFGPDDDLRRAVFMAPTAQIWV